MSSSSKVRELRESISPRQEKALSRAEKIIELRQEIVETHDKIVHFWASLPITRFNWCEEGAPLVEDPQLEELQTQFAQQTKSLLELMSEEVRSLMTTERSPARR